MNNSNHEKQPRSGLKDVWNAAMCEGACYSSNDIPICPTIMRSVPADILTWEEAKRLHKKNVKSDKNYFCDAFICFYVDDYKFDGARTSVWTYPWMALHILCHFRGIITPDFSTYQDFPYPIKVYNTYRMRAFGYWAGCQGLEVINNVRWGTSETYDYCFDGIEKNSVVAIGTVGGSPRKLNDRKRFEEGFQEMIKVLSPHTIIIYGSSKYPCIERMADEGVRVVTYQSRTAKVFEEKNNE